MPLATDKATDKTKSKTTPKSGNASGVPREKLIGMLEKMLLIRSFEEASIKAYQQKKVAGFLHTYIGHEAVGVGMLEHRLPQDAVVTTYRCHGLYLALGASPREGMAELFGKVTGCARGKGGSMHFFDVERHFYGGHGIVGGQIPVGVGMAFALKYKETGGCCLTYFGDGAINQGAFHEAANLAALYKLPVLLIVENNEYAMGTSVRRSTAEPELYKQAYAYGMTGAIVDGMDVFEVYHAMKELADEAREGKPALVEVRTYRYRGHSMSDPQKYRTKEELEAKKDEDPILRFKKYLLDHDIADLDRLDALDEEAKQEVAEAVEFAENSPFPPVETMYEDIYTQDDYPFLTGV